MASEEADATATAEEQQPSDEEIFANAAGALNRLVEARSDLADELAKILARRLQGPIDEGTWNSVTATLADVFGDMQIADVFAWVLESDRGDLQRVEQLEQAGGPHAGNLARQIIGSCGIELRTASAMRDFPHNWRELSHHVYQGLANNRTFISLTVVKENGERLFLDGPADSMLSFCKFVVSALRLAGREAFSPDFVEELLADFGELAKNWRETAAGLDGSASAGPDGSSASTTA
jgi:ribosome-binding factor A